MSGIIHHQVVSLERIRVQVSFSDDKVRLFLVLMILVISNLCLKLRD